MRPPGSFPAAGLCLLSLLVASPARGSISADSADDVCAPESNPCIVTEEIDIEPNSVLDFGQRELRIEGGGMLDFGEGESRVRCGKFVADVDDEAVAIRFTDTSANAAPRGSGIEAVRQCSDGPRACLTDYDCSLFTCGYRRCEGSPSRSCTVDAQCDLGDCQDNGRCSGFETQRCSSNADCKAGPCDEQLTCLGANDSPYACTTNADCQLGECTAGDGSIDLGGATEIDVVARNDFWILAASDLTLRKPIRIVGDDTRVNVESEFGNLAIQAPIESFGKRGTILSLLSGADLTIEAPVVSDGHELGGWIVAIADNDLVVGDDVRATTDGVLEASRDAGNVSLESGQDLRVETGTAEDPIEIRAGFADLEAGDQGNSFGGYARLSAGRDLHVDRYSAIHVNGNGSFILARSSRDVSFGGSISGEAGSADLIGTGAWISGARDVHLDENARVEISGEKSVSGGELTVIAGANLDLDASIEVHGAGSYGDEPLSVGACSVRVGSEADVLNATAGSFSYITAGNLLEVEPGAQWVCEGCENLARVRADTERVIDGDVDPAITYWVDDSVGPCGNCPTGVVCDDGDACTLGDVCRGDVCKGRRDVGCGDCGSSTIEWGEGCDDGDEEFVPGEPCSADCQRIGCGHPTGSTGNHPNASDALFVLRASVDLQSCALSVCDPNQSGDIEASDSLLVLRAAVGLERVICPLPPD